MLRRTDHARYFREHGQLSSITRKSIDKIEELLGASGGNLAYAGYPYDPFVLET
jgi:hypothetical protein